MISGLEPGRDYTASFMVKAEALEEGALFLTLAHPWRKPHCYAPAGTYNWRRVECLPFNIGDRDFVDFRFVIQAPGKVWIDDVALYKRPKP